MKQNYFDRFDELPDDEIFDEDRTFDYESEENYPTAEEYNRIHKQKYDYF